MRDDYPWKKEIDYREETKAYRVGKGEQGVLICQPYKDEMLPHWRFKTPEDAKESSEKIYRMFLEYVDDDDFVGADMARKYLQMGYTRARRYANYEGGKKYDEDGNTKEKGAGDPEKAKAAQIFKEKWDEAEANSEYAERKKAWKEAYG